MKQNRVLSVLVVSWLASCCAYLLIPQADVESSEHLVVVSAMKPAHFSRAPYAEWLHGHWISVPVDGALAALESFHALRIPVDAVVLIGDFLFRDQDRDALVRVFSSLRTPRPRIILTVDGMIPVQGPHFASARTQQFLVNDEVLETPAYWTGPHPRRGGLLDFNNPKAVLWFQSFLSPVLKLNGGVDGVFNPPVDGLYYQHAVAKGKSHIAVTEAFSAKYYYEMFDFGRQVAGFDFVTAFRPVDSFGGQMHLFSFGPQDISLASQVSSAGRPSSFAGLQDALQHLLTSVERKYLNVGMSVGRLGACSDCQELFLRWTAVAAFSSLMEKDSGSPEVSCRGSLLSTADCLAAYRNLVAVHRQLRPYQLALGSQAFLDGISERSLSADAGDGPFAMRSLCLTSVFANDCGYLLGPDLFVSPVVNASNPPRRAVTQRVVFPPHGQWIAVESFGTVMSRVSSSSTGIDVYPAKTVADIDVALGQALVFQRRGSILPLEVLEDGVSTITFLIPYVHFIRPSLVRHKFVSAQLRDVLTATGHSSEAVETAVVFGEHDHGMAVYYETEKVAGGSGGFYVVLRYTPHHKSVIAHFTHVRCGQACRDSRSAESDGFRHFSTKEGFWNDGVRNGHGRALHLGESEVVLFDPFATLGCVIRLGPFEEY